MKLGIMVAGIMLLCANASVAEQTINTKPNATIKIDASASDVTRISVAGDRIRRIIKDQTNFQEMNDQDTGDVFLRYAGDQAKLTPESGYIITERGVTIGYKLTPSSGLGAETVIIKIAGAPTPTAAVESGAARSEGFELAASGSGGYAADLVNFTRATIDKHIAGRGAPARGHGTVTATESAGGLRAKVLVASGGASGRYVRPQEFFTRKVVAVWVQRKNLGRNERAWVVVVETK